MINLLVVFTCITAQVACISTSVIRPNNTPQSTVTQGPIESKPSDASTPITVKLIMSKAPRLNEEAELTFIISSISDAPATKATIILPEGTDLISGDLEWSGALKAKEPHTMKAMIKFITEGDKTIAAKALYDLGNGDIWGDAAYLYLNSTADAGRVGFQAKPTPGSSGVEKKGTSPAITPASPPAEIEGPIESKPSEASTPITVKLIISKAPRLNEEAELTFIISSMSDAPATKATIVLPEGTDLISGDLEWSGALKAKEPYTMKAMIKFVTEGDKTIEAKALYDLGNGDIWGDAAYLYLNSTADAGRVGFQAESTPGSSGVEETPPSINPAKP
jgi:hypothetical protein